ELYSVMSGLGDGSSLSEDARDFYSYHLARNLFKRGKFDEAKERFIKVEIKSPYYVKSLFHLGIISNLQMDPHKAIRYFSRVVELSHRLPNIESVAQQAILNIARVFYEAKDYIKAVHHYSLIPRNSENYLVAQLEASWAFLLIEKPNNTL